MAGKSHDMEPTGQHPPGSCPVDETMPLFSSDVLDDEERSVLSNLKILNPSLADVSASSLLSIEVPSISPLSEIDKQLSKPPSGMVPPVTCISLALMEERMTPPSLSICHELAFDAKAKVSLHQVKYSSNEQASREHEYWIFLRQELISLTEGSIIPTLLPQLLAEIKNMILYLYPESKAISQQLIHDTDANLIVQEIRMGSLDANSFAESLSKLLKANCAPKRDPLVDHLVTLGRGGNWIGLFKSCLDLMELMKLDLINYRLLQHRQLLVRSVIPREKQHFGHLLDGDSPKMSMSTTRKWLSDHVQEDKHLQRSEAVDLVRHAFIRLLLPPLNLVESGGPRVPETFILDLNRVRDLQHSLQDVCIVAGALLVAREWVNPKMDLLGELKIRLIRALNYPEAMISDLSCQILLVATRARGSPIRGERRELLFKSVDKILDPDHRVYRLIREKMGQLLLGITSGHAPTEEDFKRAGLSTVKTEIEGIVPIVRTLWILHWNIHRDRYERLVAEMTSDCV